MKKIHKILLPFLGLTIVAATTAPIIVSCSSNPSKPNVSYNVSISKQNENNIVGKVSSYTASLTSSDNSPLPTPLYYDWNIQPNNQPINNNGNKSINITWTNRGEYNLSVKVYKGSNQNGELLAKSTPISISVQPLKDLKYGFAVDGTDEITNRKYTNQKTTFDQAIANANDFVKNKLTQQVINDALTLFANNYAKGVKNIRDSKLDYVIQQNNIKLNSDKTISGNIEIKFTFTDTTSGGITNQTRENGDVEVHNFVFENSKIEPYINTVTSNFLSFKITSKYLQKRIIFKNPDNIMKNLNVGLVDEVVYLDASNDLTLQLNNSTLTLNYDKFFQTNYLYNWANDDEKAVIKEVLTTLARGEGRLKAYGKDPSRPLNISAPIYTVRLSKQYNNLRPSFATNLSWTIASLYNFISPLKPCTIINNEIHFNADTLQGLVNDTNNSNKVIDLDNNSTIYNEKFYDTKSNNIYGYERQIKGVFIEKYQQQIGDDWDAFLNKTSDRIKAEKIYDWMLPLVSYGQSQKFASQIGGIIYGKVICQGYASLFTYLANIFNLKALTITGLVADGANPGQTDSAGKHAWNLVMIDNDWLWADPTWDDSMNPSSPTYLKDNFLIPTNKFFTPTTHLNVENWNSGLDLPVKIPTVSNIQIPTPIDLKIDKDVKSDYISSSAKFNATKRNQLLNEYGVLNTFSLMTYIYADSNVFNNDMFSDISIKLLENNDYNYLKFSISGVAKKDINDFGKFPFTDLKPNLDKKPLNLKVGNEVEVIFEYNRKNSSQMNQNSFDTGKISFDKNTSLLTQDITWRKINKSLKIGYTNEFDSSVTIKLNNNQWIKTPFGNRTLITFMYFVNDEYNSDYNGNYVAQTSSFL